jgi:phenol hydroxylase P5 protein
VAAFAVRDLVHMTPRTRVIRLDLGGQTFPFDAGQAVMAGLRGSPLRKPYSIASAPGEAAASGAIELLVQIDNSGSPDPHLERASPGTLVEVEGPFGAFGLPPLEGRPLLLIAGGTGIAPLRSMLFDALSRPQPPSATLVYSARGPEELAYRADLDTLARVGRLRVFYTITRESDIDWDGRRGRIGDVLLGEALPSPGALCVICGPPQMVQDATTILRGLGVGEERLVIEKY